MQMIIYLMQVSACTGIFYLFYYLVLARFTFFTINRWYLLCTLLVSFAIPAITIPADVILVVTPIKAVNFSTIEAIYNNPIVVEKTHAAVAKPINWGSLISILYFLVTGVLAMILLISLARFYKRIQTQGIVKDGNVKIIKRTGKHKNGSFLNYVFINEDGLTVRELEQIVAHELAHAHRLHSLDKILARLAGIILWFNPFAYAYIAAMSANHEYEVDQEVAATADKTFYANLILRLAAPGDGVSHNYFSKFPLRMRIAMLFNQPTKKLKRITYIFVLPLLLISIFCFANRGFINEEVLTPLQSFKNEVPGLAQQQLTKTSIPGKSSIKNKPEDKDSVAKNRSEISGATALTNLEKTPVEVPVLPRISAIDGIDQYGRNPLVLIDGKEYDPSILEQISKTCVAGYGLFRVKDAIEKYGDKAKEGCVKITTKDGNIVYMSDIERENLYKIRTVSINKFYTRLAFRNEDGSVKDEEEIFINAPGRGQMMSSTLKHNAKAAFLISGKIYDESQISKINGSITPKGGFPHGLGRPENFPLYKEELKSYDVVFYLEADISAPAKALGK